MEDPDSDDSDSEVPFNIDKEPEGPTPFSGYAISPHPPTPLPSALAQPLTPLASSAEPKPLFSRRTDLDPPSAQETKTGTDAPSGYNNPPSKISNYLLRDPRIRKKADDVIKFIYSDGSSILDACQDKSNHITEQALVPTSEVDASKKTPADDFKLSECLLKIMEECSASLSADSSTSADVLEPSTSQTTDMCCPVDTKSQNMGAQDNLNNVLSSETLLQSSVCDVDQKCSNMVNETAVQDSPESPLKSDFQTVITDAEANQSYIHANVSNNIANSPTSPPKNSEPEKPVTYSSSALHQLNKTIVPSVILNSPARPPDVILDSPASPPVVILDSPASPPVVILDSPASPPVVILDSSVSPPKNNLTPANASTKTSDSPASPDSQGIFIAPFEKSLKTRQVPSDGSSPPVTTSDVHSAVDSSHSSRMNIAVIEQPSNKKAKTYLANPNDYYSPESPTEDFSTSSEAVSPKANPTDNDVESLEYPKQTNKSGCISDSHISSTSELSNALKSKKPDAEVHSSGSSPVHLLSDDTLDSVAVLVNDDESFSLRKEELVVRQEGGSKSYLNKLSVKELSNLKKLIVSDLGITLTDNNSKTAPASLSESKENIIKKLYKTKQTGIKKKKVLPTLVKKKDTAFESKSSTGLVKRSPAKRGSKEDVLSRPNSEEDENINDDNSSHGLKQTRKKYAYDLIIKQFSREHGSKSFTTKLSPIRIENANKEQRHSRSPFDVSERRGKSPNFYRKERNYRGRSPVRRNISPFEIKYPPSTRNASLHKKSAVDLRRSQSPIRRARSPRIRSQSPRRRSRSPKKRPRSPTKRSRSPKKKSRSPKKRSRSPKKRTRSPKKKSRSPKKGTHSPNKRSLSPERRSSSLKRRSKTPQKRSLVLKRRFCSPQKRSLSPGRRSSSPKRRPKSPQKRSLVLKKRSCSPQKRSLSPERRSFSPKRRSKSPKRRTKSPQKRSLVLKRRSCSPQKRSLSPERRSSSPKRRSKTPLKRSLVLKRRSCSPQNRSLSPERRSSSPKKRSKSPQKRSLGLKRSSCSPQMRSLSPERRSHSPKKSSPSPKRRSGSPRKGPQSPRKDYPLKPHSPSKTSEESDMSLESPTKKGVEITGQNLSPSTHLGHFNIPTVQTFVPHANHGYNVPPSPYPCQPPGPSAYSYQPPGPYYQQPSYSDQYPIYQAPQQLQQPPPPGEWSWNGQYYGIPGPPQYLYQQQWPHY